LPSIAVIEDDPDVRFLIRTIITADGSYEIEGEAASADGALALAAEVNDRPLVYILDNALKGAVTGLEVAPRLKECHPSAKIILFTAYEHLREQADHEPAIDAFLLKTDMRRLLPLVHELAEAAS
jgi:DNA-binding NarL/FixJ family response regulator